MAGTTNDNQQFNGQLYLSPDQQDLLMAALNSNNPNSQNGLGRDNKSLHRSGQMQSFGMDGLNPAYYSSPQQGSNLQSLDNFGLEDSPFGDFLDADTSFDYDQSDPSLMIGNLPGDSPPQDDETEGGDKRKSPDEESDEVEGGAKRREGEDKTAKKPGRKPLTSEPTTKRKAQNRAAQRAFRERKERHLKDLETKVAELEKASDATNHENGLLRAQVSRLQTELREYRKRMSLNSSSLSRSPPTGGFASYMNNNNAQNNFQFEFPRFGGLPGAQMFNNGPLAKSGSTSSVTTGKGTPAGGPGVLMRQSSGERSLSPRSLPNQSSVTSPVNMNNPKSHTSANGAGRASSNSVSNVELKNSSQDLQVRASLDSSNGQNRVFQFKPGSVSSSNNSPSASSASHFGANSSAGTSPDPAQNSPSKNGDLLDTIKEGYVCHGDSEGEIAFCEKLNMACGNPRNPVPRAMSQSNGSVATANTSPNINGNTNCASTPASNNPKTPSADVSGIDHLASQNGGQFDPILFGDYRESQAAVVGDGEFTNGFFNDAFVIPDFGSPFHFGDTPAVQKSNPLEEIERLQDGIDEEVVPGEDMSQMLNCHKIWDKLSARSDVQDGSFDIEGLCSELRAKARCSESGVVVDKKDVDAALLRAREQQQQANGL